MQFSLSAGRHFTVYCVILRDTGFCSVYSFLIWLLSIVFSSSFGMSRGCLQFRLYNCSNYAHDLWHVLLYVKKARKVSDLDWVACSSLWFKDFTVLVKNTQTRFFTLQYPWQTVGGAPHNVMNLSRLLQSPTSPDRKVQHLIINTLSTQHRPWHKISSHFSGLIISKHTEEAQNLQRFEKLRLDLDLIMWNPG